jgi:cytochrome c heme-lyase
MVRWGTDVFWRASGGEARIMKKVDEARMAREEEANSKKRQYN